MTTLHLPNSLVIPLVFHHQVPILPTRIDGKECHFVLDTGAPHLFLHQSFFREDQLTVVGEVMGAAGKVKLYQAEVQELEIGAWRMGPLSANVLAKSAMDDFDGGELAGSLGFRELIHYSWLVDYQQKELRLWQKFKPADHDVTGSLRCNYLNHLPAFEATVGDQKLRLLLDTGCSDLVMDRSRLDSLSEWVQGMEKSELVGAGGNKSESLEGHLDHLKVDVHQLDRVPVGFADLSGLKARIGDFDGIIGYPLLSRLGTVVCWERKRFYFLKSEE